jgi:hypothetical protein
MFFYFVLHIPLNLVGIPSCITGWSGRSWFWRQFLCLNGSKWHVSWQVPFCCRYFPYHKKISQRKAHVLPDLHFWLVEITQKWDDVRLEPGIRSGQRSTSPVFEGLGTKNNRSIGNIGPGMARLWLEELATIHGDADPPSPYCFPKNGAPLLFC